MTFYFFCRHSSTLCTSGHRTLSQLGVSSTSENASFASDLIQRMRSLEHKFADGGGPRGHHRLTVLNKKVAPRQRLHMLFDNHHYYELNRLAGYGMKYGDIPAAGSITAFGNISDRLCLVIANDATIKGGTIYPIGVKKSLRAQELSEVCSIPSVQLVDSGGAFLPLQAEIFPDAQNGGRVFFNEANLNAAGVPQLSLVLGSSTAGGAYMPMMCDEVIMVDGISQVFLGGPPLVQAALGEIVTAEELGGAALHSNVSGCSDHFVKTEQDGFTLMRDIVSTLPRMSVPPSGHIPSDPLFNVAELDHIVFNQLPSDLRRETLYCILARIFDSSSLIEYKPTFSDNLIAGFVRLNGHQMGILASWNCLNDKDATKGAQFIEICSHRKLPLISFIHSCEDQYSDQDAMILRAKANMMSLLSTYHLPKISVVIGDARGSDYYLMGGKSLNPTFIVAWPNSLFHLFDSRLWDDCTDCYVDNPVENVTMDAFEAAGNLFVDDVIQPSRTRYHLVRLLEVATTYRQCHLPSTGAPILRF